MAVDAAPVTNSSIQIVNDSRAAFTAVARCMIDLTKRTAVGIIFVTFTKIPTERPSRVLNAIIRKRRRTGRISTREGTASP